MDEKVYDRALESTTDELINRLNLLRDGNQIDISKDDIKNIETILGTEKSIQLPSNSVDKILMVDVYHEFNFPAEIIVSIKRALKPNGELFLIEYRSEDSAVPIKAIHKMSEKQAVREMEAAGFKLKKNITNLPWQHCMVFVKKN